MPADRLWFLVLVALVAAGLLPELWDLVRDFRQRRHETKAAREIDQLNHHHA